MPLAIDFLVTSFGQPSGYWQGLGLTNEGNPFVEPILRLHYGAFLVGFIIYGTAVFLLIKKLPWKWALWLGVFLFVSHTWGSSTWVSTMLYKSGIEVNDWFVTVAYHGLLAVLMCKGIMSYYQKESST